MKRRMLLLLVLTLIWTGGCRDRTELDELGIVAALGIDLSEEPGMYEITAQLIRPQEVGSSSMGGGGAGRPFIVVSSTGPTVFDAVRKATNISSRRLFFSHNRVLILGNELAKNGVSAALDLLFRDEEFRPTVNVLVATGKARDILYAVSEFEAVPGLGLAQLLRVSSATSGIGLSTLHEFRTGLIAGHAIQPVSSLVDAVCSATVNEDWSPSGSQASPEDQGDTKEMILQLIGTAIFRDDKLVDTLDMTESRGYRWAVNRVESGIVTVRWPETGERVDVEIVAAKGQISVKMTERGPELQVKVNTSGQMAAQEGFADLTSPEALQQLEALFSEAVKYEITLALQKAQRHGADIFGFGNMLRARQPQVWKQWQHAWPEIFSQAPANLLVETHIRRYGLISKPSQPQK